ncbi:MAG: hypothetical protein JNL21_31560 [Myxococcales bacterium]|nr:hypothetical protein [Myxococcales bacterium]
MRIGATVFSVAAGLAWAGEASAQVAVDWQVSGSAGIGVTDNVANTPEPPEDAGPDVVAPQPDGFVNLSPAIEVTFETAGATQSVGWAFSYLAYFLHPEANTISNGLAYGVRAPVGPGTELTFGLSGAQANLSTFNLVSSASTTPVTPTEGGDSQVFTIGVSQGLTAEVSETVMVSQGIAASYGHTLVADAEDAKTYIASGTIGVTKQLERDALTWSVGTDAQVTPEQVVGAVTQAELAQIFHRADFNWTRQWALDWSTTLGVGALVGYDAAAPDIEVLPHPAWRGSLNYGNDVGTAALAYEHTVQPNLLLRQATANDAVTLTGAMPIPKSTFDIGATAGYQVSREFLPTTGFGPPLAQNVIADAAVGYVPKSWFVRLEVRYQYARQFAGSAEAEGAAVQPELERHAGIFTVEFGYPDSPTAGGASPFVVVPAPTANVDIMRQRAPETEQAVDENQRKEEREKREDRERRGGSGD